MKGVQLVNDDPPLFSPERQMMTSSSISNENLIGLNHSTIKRVPESEPSYMMGPPSRYYAHATFILPPRPRPKIF